MTSFRLLLSAAVFAIVGACQGESGPPARDDVTAAEEITIGGACTYDTTETTARVIDNSDDFAISMIDADGETFFLRYSQFSEVSLRAEPGKTYRVAKATITQGTCVPTSYSVIGPATEDTPAVADEEAAPPVIGGPCAYEQSTITATVLQVDGADVALIDADGKTLFQDLSDFWSIGADPQPGDRFEIGKSQITSGTCTPVSYTLKRQLAD